MDLLSGRFCTTLKAKKEPNVQRGLATIKTEPPDEAAEDLTRTDRMTPTPPSALDPHKEADVYWTEYIKVEAMISPRHTQQFVIPVELPYTESRRKLKSRSPKVGKLRMRKITELQQRPIPTNRYRSDVVFHNPFQRHPNYNPLPAAPPCTCPQCSTGRSSWNSACPYRFSAPCPSPIRPPQTRRTENNFWRPFV